MTDLLPRRGAEMSLNDDELAYLQARNDEAEHELTDRFACLLQVDRKGPPALAQNFRLWPLG